MVSLNLKRRHLNESQRAMVADELRDRPERSNRQIAAGLGVNHETVGAVREDLETTGEIRHLPKTVGADGKPRTTTPARKPATASTLHFRGSRSLQIAVRPLYRLPTMSSTRRFFWRPSGSSAPSGLAFGATGRLAP